MDKLYHYKSNKVEIRKLNNNYIVWDIKTNQIFANEKFKTITLAKKFVTNNKMIIVGD